MKNEVRAEVWTNTAFKLNQVVNRKIFYNHDIYWSKYNGLKLNKGTIIVPLECKKTFLDLFKRFNVTIKIRNIVEY